MLACDEINAAMNDLYDVFMELENRVCNLTCDEWKKLDDIASDIRKNVNRMVKNLRETIIKYDRGAYHDA